MAKGDYLGEFEHLVMLALLQLGDDAYGMTVRRLLEEQTGRKIAIGAVYATLERLEQKRYISSLMAEATPVRGGRAKRFFRVEPRGAEALRRSRDTLTRMWRMVEKHPDLHA